jgi:glucosamine 6-phosphate synthetase-like amidotransferase/phosphosugar isomerase protein
MDIWSGRTPGHWKTSPYTDIASEFRYRYILWNPKSVMVVVSQSGETADTLAALGEAKRQGIKVLAITNVVGSSVASEISCMLMLVGVLVKLRVVLGLSYR